MTSPLADVDLEKKQFQLKAEIKPWLSSLLRPQGIELFVERSSQVKIVFRCRSNTVATRRSRCPFRIRANYQKNLKVWSLTVTNDTHNHSIQGTSTTVSWSFRTASPPSLPRQEQGETPPSPSAGIPVNLQSYQKWVGLL
ncbi:hypothetical protein DIURU_004003 [Diutina rugosa]|uniref:Uncharacterized protein n=1 Tax=Diutina rugosa TaxID=5481 RepID=A0A642UN88_DIURU|nr:uncharacterized protein DIURU_004003 [Diutina rugosa]KAA8899962.1 hypothetical protein DIURU_004003 [Diutina rugosa]